MKTAMDQLNMQKYIKCKKFDVGSRFKRTINDEKVGWIIAIKKNEIIARMSDGKEKSFTRDQFKQL